MPRPPSSLLALCLLLACAPQGGLAVDRSPSDLFATTVDTSGADDSDQTGASADPPPLPGDDDSGSGGAADGLLIPARARWRYLLDAPADDWRDLAFDDSTWPEGQSPIGGGGAPDLVTELTTAAAPIAARLRHRFTLADADALPADLVLHLRRADAATIYLNGALVLRTNLVDADPNAAPDVAASGDEGRRYLRFILPGEALQPGDNVLALELRRGDALAPFAVDLQLEPAAASQSAYFQLRSRTYGGEYGDDNVGAVWVERASGEFVRTLALWAATRREHLVRWRAASGDNTVDAITSATRKSHVTSALTWDLRDAAGAVVTPGAYRLRAEFTEDNSNKGEPLGPEIALSFTLGDGGAVTYERDGYFRDVTLITP